ncbi:MAG: class I SAM-dependent methyltransferase [Oscillospiraceae bacterium]|nr:class I SAM-dependent methyltransferase [Oscillospiraceae bacterium]
MERDYLTEHYSNYDEDGRLLSRHGQVEYRTTMKYIRESLAGFSAPQILEVGAGTGRYSVTLAKEGFSVTAVELVEHNLAQLKAKLDGTEPITALQGNALDLSMLPSDHFDLTMLLGPMYHLYTREDKLQALREVMDLQMLTPDWHCISEPKDLFELVRTEDIAALDAEIPVERLKLVATDGATNYMREYIDAMDDESFAQWMNFHFAICERQDLIGASHHTLDVLKKR